MRPRILHDLSRHLAIRLEEGIRGGVEENPIPVYLCHPLDLVDAPPADPQDLAGSSRAGSGGRAVGALYLCRLAPQTRYRQAGAFSEPPEIPGTPPRRRAFGIWVKARFVFLVSGGTHEEELGALAAAMQTLQSLSLIRVDEMRLEVDSSIDDGLVQEGAVDEDADLQGDDDGRESAASDPRDAEEGLSPEVAALPLEIVDDPDVWREIGMGEHRRAVTFEVSLPLTSLHVETTGRVVDRDISVTVGAGENRDAGEDR